MILLNLIWSSLALRHGLAGSFQFIRVYREEYSKKMSKIAFFVTAGSSENVGALKDMHQIYVLTPIAELEISEQDRKTKQDLSIVSDFVTKLGN